jgi:hypothetical protein
MMKLDKRPHRKGWGPGDYFCTCTTCNKDFIGDKRAWSCADCAYADWKPTHRHRKTGALIMFLHRATIEADMSAAVVYQELDGRWMVRPTVAFQAGRYELLPEEVARQKELEAALPG